MVAKKKPAAIASKESNLTPRQLAAMDLILSGASMQEVAEKIGVARQTVSGWRNQLPAFKEKLAELMSAQEEELKQSFSSTSGYMLSQLRRLASEGSGSTRLKAIQFFFERFADDAVQTAAVPMSETDALLLRVLQEREQERAQS